ncbi:MAG: enoyl-CoA hydratase/isomerase family protein, partial [Cruoricaptor ignavus]|nr:enoyl-CoA hydratase/isomerase family protein [Cruoricaptor ignavus]
MYQQIQIDAQFGGKLQLAYLNQPESFNSLNSVLLKELKQFIHECNKNEDVRCVAISGRGKAFCSGQNLKETLGFGDIKKDRTVQRFVIDYYNPLVEEISRCRKPVIALVNGPAVGAGAMLALICDFALA